MPDRPARFDVTRHVEGLVGGALRRLTVSEGPSGTWLDMPDVATLWVAADGAAVSVVATPLDADDAVLEESVLGPGLILALALQGTFCLHASAVEVAGRAVAFVGDSGSGKSTMAAALDGAADLAWPRLADDILPVTVGATGATVHSDFPQLKLPTPRLHLGSGAGAIAAALPLAAVYELAPPQPDAPDGVVVRPLSPSQRVMALLAHSVAGQLFPAAVSERHLDAIVAIARQLPVRQLCYPRRHDIAAAVMAAIAADMTRDD